MYHDLTVLKICPQCGRQFPVLRWEAEKSCCSRACWILHERKLRIERFWAGKQVVKDCWVWQGMIDKHGYGSVTYQYRVKRVHRLAWELTHGPIPDGLSVLHTCDNRVCYNPDHLWLGTQKDNMRDMVAKGRARQGTHLSSPGEKHPMAKLTAVQVTEIRERYAAGGITLLTLGAEYGVTETNISMIIRRQTWKHLP
jgi:hypothetical protein